MMEILFQRLTDYRNEKKLFSKGELATILHVSRLAKEKGLPLNPETLVTEGKGQVLGLGKARVQSILKEYGITKVLAEEGGRTSRKSLNNMYDYVAFLNGLHQDGIADLSKIESWCNHPCYNVPRRSANSKMYSKYPVRLQTGYCNII
jgi:hypothetical protein